jgi:hypothetical protein
MKALWIMTALGLAFTGWPGMAAADPWKDESGKWRGSYERHDDNDDRDSYKEEFRIGGCEVKREWDGDEYKEEIKCKGRQRPPAYGSYR